MVLSCESVAKQRHAGVRKRAGSETFKVARPAIELVRRTSVRMVGLDEDDAG
jgi:hypothetical protein